ncbi:hypothetical protein D9756_000221 [Leucocoprinus leucothites]|uniref:Uncharacterized protein n=1 Tax=Leucocoprinus leucothites TaxID=201217 RepID=A0A8H5GDX3_9AGAR|nr:hypothetical protein D9756_000221 [Leucoagaricus leucothites]
MDALTPCFTPDPDITGLGVRINLYASSLIFAVLPETPLTLPLIDVCRANASMSGFALLVTAIVRTAQHKLTLYHAIFVLHMLFFLGIGLFPIGQYKPTSMRKLWTQLVALCIAFMFQGWAVYIWAHAPEFGAEALVDSADVVRCNASIRYIFVFVPVSATALWLRILWMIVLSLEVLGLLVHLLLLLSIFVARRTAQIEAHPIQHHASRFRPSQIPLILSYIYAIIMLELYIVRNEKFQASPDNPPETWSFGQILNLAMIANSSNEVVHFLLAYTPSLSSRSGCEGEGAAELNGLASGHSS